MEIVSLNTSDLDSIENLTPEGWSGLKEIHTFYLNNRCCYPVKILSGNTIIGIGTAICNQNTGWLAHIIVAGEHRHRGIGSAIVSHLVNHLTTDCACKSISLIATDLGYPVYKKFGFNTQSEYVTFNSQTNAVGSSLPDTITVMEEIHLPQVLALDKRVSGEDRSTILCRFLDEAYVGLTGKRVTGFYLTKCGEGLIISEEEETGLKLLALKIRTSNKVVLPMENVAAGKYLIRNGFQETKRMHRMIYGEIFAWKPQCIYNRIGGFLG